MDAGLAGAMRTQIPHGSGDIDPCPSWGHRAMDPCPAWGHGKTLVLSLLWGQRRQCSTALLAGCTRQVQGQGPSTPPEPPGSGPPLIVGLPAFNHSLGSSQQLGSAVETTPKLRPAWARGSRTQQLLPAPLPPQQHPCSQPLSSVPSLPLPALCFLLGNTQGFSGLTRYFSSERAGI